LAAKMIEAEASDQEVAQRSRIADANEQVTVVTAGHRR
jgi:hypothetical protein